MINTGCRGKLWGFGRGELRTRVDGASTVHLHVCAMELAQNALKLARH
jgi:hypothetical protein